MRNVSNVGTVLLAIVSMWHEAEASRSVAETEKRIESPTFEKILDASRQDFSNVQWDGHSSNHSLMGESNGFIKKVELESSPKRSDRDDEYRGARFSLSPSGRSIAVLEGGSWVVHNRTAPQGGSTSKLTAIDIEASTQAPVWSHDERFLAFLRVEMPVYYGRNDTAVQTVRGVRVIDVGADLDKRNTERSTIMIVDLRGSRPSTFQLEVPYGIVTGICWDQSHSLLVAKTSFLSTIAKTFIYRWTKKGGLTEILSWPGRMPSLVPRLSPNGQYLAVALDLDNAHWPDFMSLVIVDMLSFKQRRLTKGIYVSGEYKWSSDSKRLVFIARRGGFDDVCVVSTDGMLEIIASGDLHHFDLDVSRDGRLISYQTLDGHGLRDIRIVSLANRQERVLRVTSKPQEKFELGRFDHWKWKNADGQERYGYAVYPQGFDVNNRYPLLVDVHGGGAGSPLSLEAPFSLGISPGPLEWHVWAAQGYVVFVPDFGSSGTYGEEVVATRYRDRDLSGISSDADDIESGVKELIKRGGIDAGRVAIRGHSAGGARVVALLSRSPLFGAAVLNESIPGGPLETLIASTTGYRTGQEFELALAPALGGRISEIPEEYMRGNVFSAYRIRAPTLILVGSDLTKVPVPPITSEVLFSMLRQYGTPTRMLRFCEQGHVYSSREAAMLAFIEMKRWLDKYIPKSDGYSLNRNSAN